MGVAAGGVGGGGWREVRGILSTFKVKQKGFCPREIYRKDSVHLVKMSGRDYINVAKNMGGIMPTYTKMSRRDYVREWFCSTLLLYMEHRKQVNLLLFYTF